MQYEWKPDSEFRWCMNQNLSGVGRDLHHIVRSATTGSPHGPFFKTLCGAYLHGCDRANHEGKPCPRCLQNARHRVTGSQLERIEEIEQEARRAQMRRAMDAAERGDPRPAQAIFDLQKKPN